MDRSGKRSLALGLAVCLLLGLLAGCGKKENDQQLSANVYVPKYLELGIDADYISDSCSDGEYMYLVAVKYEDIEEKIPSGEAEDVMDTYYRTVSRYNLYRAPLDGSGKAEALANYTGPVVPEGKEGSCSVEQMSLSDDGSIWVTETVDVWGSSGMTGMWRGTMDAAATAGSLTLLSASASESEAGAYVDAPAEEPVEDEYSQTIVRKRLDKDGGTLESVDISNLDEKLSGMLGDDEYINGRTFGPDGNLYVSTGSKIYAMDPQLNILFQLEGEDMYGELLQLGGGLMGMEQWDYDEATETSSHTLKTIDLAKKDWGVEYEMPANTYNIFTGGGDYLFYYQVNDAIFGFKAGEPSSDGKGAGAGERLFSWIEADINNDSVRDFSFLPDGRVAAVLSDWDERDEKQVASAVVMTSTPRDQLPEKTTLVYASLYLGYDARQKIIDFNKTSEQYRIEVKDYS